MSQNPNDHVFIYQNQSGQIELKWDINKETIWWSLTQIAELFWVQKPAISKHLKNIFESGELDEKVVVSKMEITTEHWAIKGKTQTHNVKYYNLDAIISVWYRVNSKQATHFRQRATQTLKQHITQWYTINTQLLEKNHSLFQQALADIQSLSNNQLKSDDMIELIKAFSKTWFSLDAFDKGTLETKPQNHQTIQIQADHI